MSLTRSAAYLTWVVSILCLGGVCGCSHKPAESAAKYLDRGKAHLSAKDYARAALDFRNVLAATPDNPEAHYQLGLAYLGIGGVDEAAAEFRRTVQLRPAHVDAQVKLAELMLRSADSGVLSEAQQHAQQALRADAGNVDAMNALALAELKLGNMDDAEQQLKLALDRFPQSLNASVALAMVRVGQKDFKGAEEILKAAAAKAPASPNPALALAQLNILAGRWAEAETQFRTALRIDPKNAVALSGLATVELRQGRSHDAEETYRTLSSLPDKRYRHLHAAYLLQQGNYDAGVKEFEALAAEDPKDKVQRIRLVEAYLQAKRPSDAQRVISGALKTDPNDVDALFRHALLQLDAGNQKEADAALNRLFQKQPHSAAVHFLMARVSNVRGDEGRRRAELGEAVRLDPTFLPARVELARTLAESNSANAALDLMNQVPESQRHTVSAMATRGLIFIALGKTAEARQEVSDGLALSRTPDLLMQDAVLKLGNRDYLAARAAAVQALTRAPEDVRALRMIAVTYVAQKRTDEGVNALQQYAARYPRSPVVQQFVADWLLEIGKPQQARAGFLAAKAADPNFLVADFALVRMDTAQGNLAAARQTLLEVLNKDAGNFTAHALLGGLDVRSNAYPAAIEHYKKALEARPNSIGVMNNLAYLLAESGQIDAALQYAQKCRQLAPNSPDTADTMGWALYRKGLYDGAVTSFQEAVSKDGPAAGENAVIRKYHLAMAYAKTGDLERADQLLAQGLKANAKLPEASMARQAIAEAESPGKASAK